MARLAFRIPQGLEKCEMCGEWKGMCLYRDYVIEEYVWGRAYCQCENDSICKRCGRPFYRRKIGADYFTEERGLVHVPFFVAWFHKCCEIETNAIDNNEQGLG